MAVDANAVVGKNGERGVTVREVFMSAGRSAAEGRRQAAGDTKAGALRQTTVPAANFVGRFKAGTLRETGKRAPQK